MAHSAKQHFDISEAARKVGLPVADRTILFDDESETPVLIIFENHMPSQISADFQENSLAYTG